MGYAWFISFYAFSHLVGLSFWGNSLIYDMGYHQSQSLASVDNILQLLTLGRPPREILISTLRD